MTKDLLGLLHNFLSFHRLGKSLQTNNEDLEEGISCRQGSLSGKC